jgi:pimeloyl-ACP methyl ester carboxylesterase
MEQTLDVQGRHVRILEAGRGAPALFVHAFPLAADLWRPQLDAVPEGWRFIAPDLRGFGPRPADAEPVRDVDGHARDLIALADHLGLARFTVVGLSMGGYVAMALARLAPARLGALVLCDTRAEADTEEGRQNRERMREALRTGGPAAVADAMVPRLLGPTSQRERPALRDLVRATIERNRATGIDAAIVALMTRPDASAGLQDVACPTLVVVGAEDGLTPVEAHVRMQTLIAGSRLEVIDGAGHLSNLERPDAFNAILHRFLGERCAP